MAYHRLSAEKALTPAIFWFELRNVLVLGERRGRLTKAQTERFLEDLGNLRITVDRDPNESALLSLARTHRFSVYDAAYLELAQRESVALATLDKALIRAAHAENVPLVGGDATVKHFLILLFYTTFIVNQ